MYFNSRFSGSEINTLIVEFFSSEVPNDSYRSELNFVQNDLKKISKNPKENNTECLTVFHFFFFLPFG